MPASTELSNRISRDLKKRGMSFVGSTIMYAFMQAMGLVNDHMPECVVRAQVERARKKFVRPARSPSQSKSGPGSKTRASR